MEAVSGSNGNFGSIQNSTARLSIGATVGTSGTIYADPFGGDIGELLVLPYIATVDSVQRVEGYLAHKWGLTANLPSDHPYRWMPPTPGS